MKHSILFIVFLLLSYLSNSAQSLQNDFETKLINKKVREFTDKFDLSTPLNSYITFTYLRINGKKSLEKSASSYRIKGFMSSSSTKDIMVSAEKKQNLLNTKILKIIIYKDSVAGVITDYQDSLYLIRYLSLEDNSWLNSGEDIGYDSTDIHKKITNLLPNFLNYTHKINELKTISSDSLSYVNYLKSNGVNPKQFLLNALSKNKIVIYGEIHKRKISWDLMKEVIQDNTFYKIVNTIFMELPSDKQSELDRFFEQDTLNTEIILSILRSVQLYGWCDRGMYEFISSLWILNQSLPDTEKIKVIAVDIPRPFDSLKTKDEYDSFFNNVKNRNDHMTNIISETIDTMQNNNKSYLFIVGVAHAYKSSVGGIASGILARPTVGAQLSGKNILSIFSHCPIISNNGTIHGKVRNGIFDYAFSKIKNIPIAFDLHDSPFGKEPFDAIYEISYNPNTKNYEDNFDAYVFLGPLEEEDDEYILYELFTDEFIQEMKMRAFLSNSENTKWYGIIVNSENFTKDQIIQNLRNTKKKRWQEKLD